ncbi:MAG: hypothetical protein ABIZ04_20305 [Opitutus sp.]
MGRFDEAVAAFAAQLSSSPNRFNSLYGAAHASELAGDKAGATRYYQQLLSTAAAADAGSDRTPLAHARGYILDLIGRFDIAALSARKIELP